MLIMNQKLKSTKFLVISIIVIMFAICAILSQTNMTAKAADEPVVDTTNTRVSAYLTSINSDNTSTAGELITSDLLVPLKPTIKLQFSNNVVANASQNIGCVNLLNNNGQPVADVNIFALGAGDRNDPEKTNIFVQPNTPLELGATYKIVISPAVTFKNGETLGEPAVEISFTTIASVPDVTLAGALLSSQTLTMTGLPAGADLEYRIVTGSTAGDWTALTYTETTAAIDTVALSITSGVSQVEVRGQGGVGTTVGKTVYLAVDGNKAELINGVPMVFEDNVTVTAENLNPAGTNQVSLKRYVMPMKYYIDPVGFGYEVYLQGAGDGSKATLSFPVDPSLDINKMSVFALDKSDASQSALKYLTPDRSQAAQHIISVVIDAITYAGETNCYQVFYDDVKPYPIAITAQPIIDASKIVITQIQASDNDLIDYIEVYRDNKLIGEASADNSGCWNFTDADPDLQAGQTYTYNVKAYDRVGNYNGLHFGDYKVLFESDASVVEKVRQQLEDGTIPITYALGDSADHVTTDIGLPYQPPWDKNTYCKWVSSDPETINSGTNAQVVKSADGSDKFVTLTATITRGSAQAIFSKKVRVTWEPGPDGLMYVRNYIRGIDANDEAYEKNTMFELYRALDQENIHRIVVIDNFGEELFTNNVLDCKGKTLVVKWSAFMCQNRNGVNLIIKNAVVDANGTTDPYTSYMGYSSVALGSNRGGLAFDNVEFKGGENLDSFIRSQGGSLVLTNCRFGKTKVAPVVIQQPPGGGINEPTGVRIENCTFNGVNKPGNAILYQKDGTLTALNNTISGYQGKLSDGNPSAGFMIAPGRTAILTGNVISNCDNGILVQTRSSANTTINDIKITNTATATAAGTALLENNDLAAGSGPVVAVNNVDGLFNPVFWYKALADNLSASTVVPTWTSGTLTVGTIDETELTLSWKGVNEAAMVTGYRVYCGANLIATVSDTSYQVVNLIPGNTYQFKVEAGNAQNQWSINGPVVEAATLPNSPPVWPEGSKLIVTKVGPNSVNLSWTAANDKSGIRTYNIHVLNGITYENWYNSSCLSGEVAYLQPNTEYTFQVRAEDNMRLKGLDGPTVTVETTDGTPTNWTVGRNRLSVSNLTSTGLTLNWRAPHLAKYPGEGSGMKAYKLFCNGVEMANFPFSVDAKGNLLPKIPNANTRFYNITGLKPGTTYTFKLEVLEDKYDPAKLQWTTDGPNVKVTTPAQGSRSSELGQPVTLCLQGDFEWWQSISDVQLGADVYADGTSIMNQCTITQGCIEIAADALKEAKDYTILIRAKGYPDCFVTQTLTAASGETPGSEPVITPVYSVTPVEDTAYSVGATPDGIKTMTVNSGVTGFRLFSINVAMQRTNPGDETAVFVHFRNGTQIGINFFKADFDIVNTAKAGFDVLAGDVVKAYIVNDLTNAVDANPIIFQ